MKLEGGFRYLLSTGRRVQALDGVLGLTDDMLLTGGWDTNELDPNSMGIEGITPEERAEIADFMIERWQKWKKRP